MACNLSRYRDALVPAMGRNPLTGLSGLQRLLKDYEVSDFLEQSQSPYGAMWFATDQPDPPPHYHRGVAIPLRG